jgi:hypothetical protein
MNAPLSREFRLSFQEGLGVRCGADGAFVGDVALIERIGNEWAPRESEELSAALSKAYGLPVDVSPKQRAFLAIARALNECDVARAQLATLFAHFPDLPQLAKRTPSPNEIVKLALALDWAGLLKINPNHYPAGPKGGQFAPKDADADQNSESDSDLPDIPNNSTDIPKDGVKDLATRSESKAAMTAATEAAEQAVEHQVTGTTARAAVEEAAASTEKAVIRVAARRAFRAAALDALKNVGEKLVLSEIPIVGQLADVATVYDVIRFAREFYKLREAIAAATRFVNEGAHTLAQLRVSSEGLSFSSYGQFLKQDVEASADLEKRFGSAGDGMQYHHIIEEGSGVASNLVENADNIVRIPAILHEAINAIYATKSSKYGGLTLRDWLKGQSADVKREYGIKVLRDLGIIVDGR